MLAWGQKRTSSERQLCPLKRPQPDSRIAARPTAADQHHIFTAAPVAISFFRTLPALRLPAAPWPATIAATLACSLRGQSAVVEALASWAAGFARKPWQ